MSELSTKPLNASTWEAFDALVEKDGGVWGGCWCIGFHLNPKGPKGQMQPYRSSKHKLVCEGRAHASLVYEGDQVIGWCQFGPTVELPNIKHRKQYESEPGTLPDWRITCFYVGKGHRHKGVAEKALAGALELIAAAGGGVVESYPEDVTDRKVSGSFLYNATLALFERYGFERKRRLGKNHWVVSRRV